jgi:hypothetical protein
MAAFLGGLVFALLLIVAGLWATVRRERGAHRHTRERMSRLEGYVLHLESHERRAAQDADVRPHAIRFVVVRDEAEAADDDRPTDVDTMQPINLAAMGNNRPTLT